MSTLRASNHPNPIEIYKKNEHKYYFTTFEGQRPGITNIGCKPYEKGADAL